MNLLNHLTGLTGHFMTFTSSRSLLISIYARLKGFINGVNPRWGTKTVIVSDRSGDIVKLESRGKNAEADDSTTAAFD